MSTLYLVGVTNLQNNPGGFANTDTALAPIRAYIRHCGIKGEWSHTQKGIAHRISRFQKYGKFLLLTKEQADLAVAHNRPNIDWLDRNPIAEILCTFDEYKDEINELKKNPSYVNPKVKLTNMLNELKGLINRMVALNPNTTREFLEMTLFDMNVNDMLESE